MKASLIVRTLNEEKRVGVLLERIRQQSHRDLEVIVVDSGSTDRTLDIVEPQCDALERIHSRDFTFGYSINTGAARASGDIFVLISAHAYPVDDRWLERLLEPFEQPDVAMTFGRHIGVQETKFAERRDFERLFGAAHTQRHPLPFFANNANAAVRAALWRERPFDEYVSGLEDIEWARHFHQCGKRIVYVPSAAVHHVHEEVWPQVYNRYRREAMAARYMELDEPPMASPKARVALRRVAEDTASAIACRAWHHIPDSVRFRFEQWRGSRDGWKHHAILMPPKLREELFYSTVTNHGVMIQSPQTSALRTLPMPEVKPSDVLIRVAYTGICSTDLEVYEGSLGYYKEGRAQYPIVPGHEFSGVVAQVGANVTTVRIGDRVVGECVLSCRSCAACQHGSHTACEQRTEVGVMNRHGGYAKYLTLPSGYVHAIPDTLSLEKACLVEPLSVVLRGLRRLPNLGASPIHVGVLGAGPIGNFVAQVLALRGNVVTVFEHRQDRRDALTEIATVQGTIEDMQTFDVLVESTGRRDVLERVLRESRADATLLLFGFPYGEMSFNFEEIVAREKRIIGSVGGSAEDFESAIALLPQLQCEAMMQSVFPLVAYEEAWETHRQRTHLKVMLAL